MTRIVTTHYLHKRPPKKRKAVALEVPRITEEQAGQLRQANAKAKASGDAVGRTVRKKRKFAMVTSDMFPVLTKLGGLSVGLLLVLIQHSGRQKPDWPEAGY